MFKDILVYLLQGDIFNMVGVKWGWVKIIYGMLID